MPQDTEILFYYEQSSFVGVSQIVAVLKLEEEPSELLASELSVSKGKDLYT